jgi:hypothetical protein
MEMQRVKAIHAKTMTRIFKVAMMVAIATKSRRLALLCELDISDCLLACTVIFIPVSLLHFILYEIGGEGNNGVTGAGKHTTSIEHVRDFMISFPQSEFTKGVLDLFVMESTE